MNPEEIAKLLAKAVESAIGKETPAPAPANAGLADLAKAVQGINDRLENLDKVVVKNEPETPDAKIDALTKTVTDLAGLVAKVASGEKIEKKDEPLDLTKMTQEQFDAKVLSVAKSLIKGKTDEEPDGEGKEDLATLLKTLVSGKEADSELEIDLDDVEMEDVAGNALGKKARSSRKELDDWFGKKLSGMEDRMMGSSAAEDDDEDDNDEGDED